jgi:hypothetical protein
VTPGSRDARNPALAPSGTLLIGLLGPRRSNLIEFSLQLGDTLKLEIESFVDGCDDFAALVQDFHKAVIFLSRDVPAFRFGYAAELFRVMTDHSVAVIYARAERLLGFSAKAKVSAADGASKCGPMLDGTGEVRIIANLFRFLRVCLSSNVRQKPRRAREFVSFCLAISLRCCITIVKQCDAVLTV